MIVLQIIFSTKHPKLKNCAIAPAQQPSAGGCPGAGAGAGADVPSHIVSFLLSLSIGAGATFIDGVLSISFTFNLKAPGKNVSFIPVSVLNCPYFGD